MNLKAILLGSVVLLGAQYAAATSVYVQFDPAYSSPVTVDRTVDGGANWYMQDPGQFHFFTQAGSPANVPAAFFTFCIEPREFVSPGSSYIYNLVTLDQGATNIGGMGVTRASLLQELIFRNFPDFSVQVDTLHGAALQVAIWEIVREGQQGVGAYNLATGDVQYRTWSDTAVRDLAQTMLSQLTGSGQSAPNVYALALSGGVQDILVQLNGSASVPEPGSLLATGLGLMILGLAVRGRTGGAKRIPTQS